MELEVKRELKFILTLENETEIETLKNILKLGIDNTTDKHDASWAQTLVHKIENPNE